MVERGCLLSNQYDLNYLKEYMTNWMEHYGDSCWMSLFYENHDNPRMISKVNPDPIYRVVLAKLLAMIQLTLKGTPFIFQGQEIGSVNKNFTSIDELKDVESINLYQELLKTMDKDAALRKVLSGSRDHARTPMQWNNTKNAGFTEGTPWIKTDEDYLAWNVDKQLETEDSILNFYKKLIHIRKNSQALVYGEFVVVERKRKDLFNYFRKLDKDVFYVECNLSAKPKKRYENIKGCELLLSNYLSTESILRPYEANLYRKKQ